MAYLEAMKEIGVTPKVAEVQKIALWDGPVFDGVAFDPADPEKYAKGFAVHSMA